MVQGDREPPKVKKKTFYDIFRFFSLLLVVLKFKIFFITIVNVSVTFMIFFRIVEALFIS